MEREFLMENKAIITTVQRVDLLLLLLILWSSNCSYNGKTFRQILITPEMIGHHLGEFSFTKKLGSSIHNSKHNAKKKANLRRKITQKKIRKPATKGKKTVKKK